jgi:hypothetical protein
MQLSIQELFFITIATIFLIGGINLFFFFFKKETFQNVFKVSKYLFIITLTFCIIILIYNYTMLSKSNQLDLIKLK